MPRFGDIELEALIGRGGMADVYRGRFVAGPREGWHVAIKRLNAQRSADPLSVKLFLSEGALSQQLKHPNIVETYDSGVLLGIPFIAMELVEGVDLSKILRRAQELGIDLPIDFAGFLAASIADGLHYAHRAVSRSGQRLGIVHCDVSPSNVFISRTGEIKLGDFGVARAAGSPQIDHGAFGKLGYSSPEQLRGEDVAASGDIYALGLLAYELFTGQPAYAASELKAMLKLMKRPPVAPSALRAGLAASIDEVILGALETAPADRVSTALAFADKLRLTLDDRVGTPMAIAALVRGLFHANARPVTRARPKTAAVAAVTKPKTAALAAAARPKTTGAPARPRSRALARPASLAKNAAARPSTRSTARPPTRKGSAPRTLPPK